MKSPIFVFSLPRAGSTLLQRVLMSHDSICSLSEPWVLLPQVYSLRQEGVLTEYSHITSHIGISDFVQNLPNGRKDYLNALGDFISQLYEKQCVNNEDYYLDKTPRYYLIIDEIAEIFPNAKFIFIFRSPIQIMASMVNTWGNGRFNKLLSNYFDIINGIPLLSNSYLKYKDRSHSLNYEQFVQSPSEELKRILDYLDLDFNEEILTEFSKQNTKGRLGDPTGVLTYSKVSTQGLLGWQNTFNSVLRKRIALNALKKINANDLETQGYNKASIVSEVKKLNNKNNKYLFRDGFDYFISVIFRKFNLNLLMDKNFSWVRKKYMS